MIKYRQAFVAVMCLLLTTMGQAKAEAQRFNIQFWRSHTNVEIGDTVQWTWRIIPDGEAEDDLVYLNLYHYDDVSIVDVVADGDFACTEVRNGFYCNAIGLTQVGMMTATVQINGDGYVLQGKHFYAHAVVGAYAGGSFQHSIEQVIPTALPAEDEPFYMFIFLPEIYGYN